VDYFRLEEYCRDNNYYKDMIFYKETVDRIAYKVDISEVDFITKTRFLLTS